MNSRVRLKGYDGPFQSSEHFMAICYFNSTLFNNTPVAYYYNCYWILSSL